jgi:hypothetical protein
MALFFTPAAESPVERILILTAAEAARQSALRRSIPRRTSARLLAPPPDRPVPLFLMPPRPRPRAR